MEGHNAITKKAVQQGVALGMALFGVLVFAHPARAATTLNGFPSGAGGLMSLANSPYIITGDISVPSGSTLTIEPGVVVKMQAGLRITASNGHIVIGSADDDNPVVITSYKDDAYGGDTNNDGATAPAPGDWERIAVSGASSTLTINNAIIRYGGLSTGNMVALITGASGDIADATLEYSNAYGISIADSATSLTLTDAVVQHNTDGVGISTFADATITGTLFTDNRRGLAVDTNADVDHLVITGNTFSGNDVVFGSDPTAGIHFSDADDTLVATNNWWGHASGPTIASNPGGTGDAIVGNVTYDPWTNQDPANQAPTLSYAGGSGYTADGVAPDVSFKTQSVPVFKVLFADPEGSLPSYVRLVIASSTLAMATSTAGVYEYAPGAGDFGKGLYSYHFEASDGISTARLPASGELSFEVKLVPVILVPGIMGTELWKGDDKIWPDILQMAIDPDDDFMDVLAMNSDGTFVDSQITLGDIVRNPPTKDIFAGLIEELVAVGYQEDADLFVFPYDWRVDLQTSSSELKSKIDDVTAQTNNDTVNVVAHSMGGLLTKQYVLDNGSSSIDKLVFVGTPHLGAPKAAKTLLLGDDLGIRLVFPALSADRIKHISQNMPSVYQLLPSQLYVAQNGPYFYDFTTSDTTFTYAELNDYFTGQGLNSSLIQTASSFHSTALDDFDATGIDAYNISGCNTPTISSITKKRGLFRTEYWVNMSAGDGTVPISSSKAVSADNGKTYYFNNIDHAEMPSTDGIRELITQIIAGADVSLPNNATQDSSICNISGRMISVHSPVNLHIYDSEGNHVGRGENGDIEYEISGVAYEEIGENKFVFLPESGGISYEVVLDGTDEGTFSLRVSSVANNEVVETAYYNDLPVSSATEATLTLAASVSGVVLSVDQNGTGNFATISVAAVLDSQQSSDTTRPSTTISVTGGASSAAFELSASDDNAGILKTEYSLDNGSTWQNYQNQVILTTLGENTVLFRSKDRAGNLEDYQTQIIRVYSPAVIIVPTSSVPNSDNTETDRHPDPPRHSERSEESREPRPEILGQKTERSQNEQYTQDEILTALQDADIGTLLDYLGLERNLTLEQETAQKHSQRLGLHQAGVNFIAYGTKSTQRLGTGERAGVLYSFREAFGRLPSTNNDWDDVVKIATNQLPNQRSASAEQKARNTGVDDEKSIVVIAYGLRPTNRDLGLEQRGLVSFVETYGRLPSSTFDWNILRSIVY